MRLLLTRAAEDAARTRAKLEAAGHQVLLSPVLSYRGLLGSWPRHACDAILASSARAFSMLPVDLQAIAGRHLPLYLVGRRTLEEARRKGFEATAELAADGAALTELLQPRPPMRLLYLAAVDRKPDVEIGLAAAGHRLHVIEAYEARAALTLSLEARLGLQDGSLDAVLHYSRRSAAIFLTLCRADGVDPMTTMHLCLSPDVAEALPGPNQIRVADAPNEAAMLALVETL